MPSTITLQGSINFAQPFMRFMPLTIGSSNEPAVTIANTVKQIILGPPFCWKWNRATLSGTLAANTQDVSITNSTFGFIEKASVTDPNNAITEIENIKDCLGLAGATSGQTGRPHDVAAQIDGGTSITFRTLPAADQAYTLGIIMQQKPTLFTSTLTTTWTPIPDEYSFIYNQGFVAFSLLYYDDARWAAWMQRFVTSLLNSSEGLTESQKNLFRENWLVGDAQTLRQTAKAQASIQRGA